MPSVINSTQSSVRKRLVSLLDAGLSYSPFQRFYSARAAQKVTVLAYHDVYNPEIFEQHLIYLAENMHPISLAELLAAINGDRDLPRSSVLVTFDDGYRSVLECAMPVMRSLGIPGVVFVVAGVLNTQDALWTAEVRELARNGGTVAKYGGLSPEALVQTLKKQPDHQRLEAIAELRASAKRPAAPVPQLLDHELRILEANGIAVGNHTMTHPCLTQCTEEKVRSEIADAHNVLTEALGHAPAAFAYPNGDDTDHAAQVLAELGYGVGFVFDHRHDSMPVCDRYRVSRLRVDSDTPMARFRTIVSGLHPALHHALGRK